MTREVVHYSPTQPAYDIVVKRTRREVERELRRGMRAKEYGAASEILRPNTGRYVGWYVVKVERVAPPAPAWVRPVKVIGGVLAGIGVLCTGLALAVGAMLDAAAEAARAVPWGSAAGALAVLFALVLVGTRAGRRCCRVVVEHWH